MHITRANVDQLLDAGKLGVRLTNGRVWKARRNGATRLWKRNPKRIEIPFKVGFKICGRITEVDFNQDGTLSQSYVVLSE